MQHRARVATALVVLVGLVGAAVAGVLVVLDRDPEPEYDVDADRAAARNQPLTEQLTLRWKLIDDVVDAHAGYRRERTQAAPGTVVAYAVCDSCDLVELEKKLVGDLWRSELVEVASFDVAVAHDADRDAGRRSHWDVEADAKRLYDRYGNGMVDPDELDTQ